MADESVPAASAVTAVSPVAMSVATAALATNPLVVFAPPAEVVQPLPGDNALSVPSAEGVIATPDADYASLSAMVADVDTAAPLDPETHCLATAIFYESRSESLEGQLAVARVIINRVRSARFSDSLCGVIRQRGQFSFVRRGVIPAPKVSRPAWKTSIAVARIAQNNAWESEAEGALYFHARRVSPGWGRSRIAAIDNHIFYR